MGEVARLYATLGMDDSSFRAGVQNAKQGLGGLLSGLTGGKLAAMGLAGAFTAVGNTIRQSVQETAAYNKGIRELASITGRGTEEISRIVQVADDWGVGIGEVRQALVMATKNGFAPSINSLAELADRYNNTASVTEQAAMMTKIFGRNWTALQPILAQGGAALRDAASGVRGSLIVTEEAAQKTREYELAADELNDAWMGFKMAIGNAVIPTLTDFMNMLNGTTYKGKISELEESRDAALKASTSYEEYSKRLEEVAKASNYVVDETGALIDRITHARGTVDYAVTSWWRLTEAEYAAIKAAENIPDDPLRNRMKLQNPEIKDGGFAEGVQRSMEDLDLFMSGQVSETNKQYQIEVKQMEQDAADLSAEIDKLRSKPWLDPGGTKVNDLIGQLDALHGKMIEADADREKQNKQLQFDMIKQQLLQIRGGQLTEQDAANLMTIAEKWGLIDSATVTAWEKAKEWADQIAFAGDQVNNVQEKINGLHGKDLIFRVMVEGDASLFAQAWRAANKRQSTKQAREEGTEGGGRAAGGPVSSGVSYLVGERGPEIFVPDRNGRVVSNSDASGLMGGLTVNNYGTLRVESLEELTAPKTRRKQSLGALR